MSGKAAAFGGRMMNTVADQILKQFVDNFNALAQSVSVAQAAPSADGPSPDEPAVAVVRPPARQSELNGLSLAWAVLQDWLRRVFSRKTA